MLTSREVFPWAERIFDACHPRGKANFQMQLAARGVGIDIDLNRIKESYENASKAGVADRVKFIQEDIFKADLSEATVVYLYLLPELNVRLRSRLLKELKPGSRVISHEFDMGEWKPDNRGVMENMEILYNPEKPDKKDLNYYLWVIPGQAAGTWRLTISGATGRLSYILRLNQKFQEISGSMISRGQGVAIDDARLMGGQISFTITEEKDGQKIVMRFYGQISKDTIQGSVDVQGGPFAGTHSWRANRRL